MLVVDDGVAYVEGVEGEEGGAFPSLEEVLCAEEEPEEESCGELDDVVDVEGFPCVGDGGDDAGYADDA